MKIDRLSAAILRMMRGTQEHEDRMFYGSMLLKTIMEPSKQVPTMAVTVQNAQLYLYYNPEFADSLTMMQLIAVLEHEVLHLIYEHTNVKNGVIVEVWNLACDMAINQDIKNLPQGAVYPETVNLPRGKNSAEYYRMLKNNLERVKIQVGKGGGTIDDHSKWREMSESEKEVVRQAIESTIKDQGTVPGKIEEQVNKWLKHPTIPWHMVLRHYLRSSVRAFTKASWKRPNRKLGEAVKGKIPDRIAKVVVAIDTSGSITQGEFQKFMAELYGLAKHYPSDITIIQADADVRDVSKLRKGQTYQKPMKGRGGTSFEPVFKYIREKKLNPDVLVYLTDLFGEFPEQPRFSVIWAVTPEGADQSQIPYGRYVQIKEEETEEQAA